MGGGDVSPFFLKNVRSHMTSLFQYVPNYVSKMRFILRKQTFPISLRTYFTRWLIHATSLVQIHTIFAKSYVFNELLIHMNLYKLPTPNPAPKRTLHWGLDKSNKIVRVRSYELATS